MANDPQMPPETSPGAWVWQPAPPPPPSPLAPPPPPGPPGRTSRGRTVLAIVLVLLTLAGGIGVGWALRSNEGHFRFQGPGRQAPHGRPGGSGGSSGGSVPGIDAQAIAAQVDDAVVDVTATLLASSNGEGGLAHAAGTGMLLTSSGEVLTNNHVIEGSTSVSVTIPGRSGSFPAEVVGVNPSADVALLRLSGVSGLPVVTPAATQPSVGDPVVALGNANGQGGAPAVTAGRVTALERSITVGDGRGGGEQLNGLIQTDASIVPGDSGGPLVDRSGDVVGIITAGSQAQNGLRGSLLGFAVPIDDALATVTQIRSGHETSDIIIGPSGFLGVSVRELDPQTAAQLGLDVTSGPLVVSVIPQTPAESAGISSDSVITKIDGQALASAKDLGTVLHQHNPGDAVRVTWVDATGTHGATVRLIAGPAV